MFRHKGKNRTLRHNLRIATLLSFVAGMVNVAGFLSVQQLTTNVTGHFAFFVEEIYTLDVWRGMVYFLFIFFFFLGSFTSGLILEFNNRKNNPYIFVAPILIEASLILTVAVFGEFLLKEQPNIIAYILLFAMGLQNSLVTLISNSVVRTTHLTGLFTDLGIEISQLFFYKADNRKKLISSIELRLSIIVCFFLGGILSAISYSNFGLKILIIPAILLLIGLVYDSIRLRIQLLKRDNRHRKHSS